MTTSLERTSEGGGLRVERLVDAGLLCAAGARGCGEGDPPSPSLQKVSRLARGCAVRGNTAFIAPRGFGRRPRAGRPAPSPPSRPSFRAWLPSRLAAPQSSRPLAARDRRTALSSALPRYSPPLRRACLDEYARTRICVPSRSRTPTRTVGVAPRCPCTGHKADSYRAPSESSRRGLGRDDVEDRESSDTPSTSSSPSMPIPGPGFLVEDRHC